MPRSHITYKRTFRHNPRHKYHDLEPRSGILRQPSDYSAYSQSPHRVSFADEFSRPIRRSASFQRTTDYSDSEASVRSANSFRKYDDRPRRTSTSSVSSTSTKLREERRRKRKEKQRKEEKQRREEKERKEEKRRRRKEKEDKRKSDEKKRSRHYRKKKH